MAETWNVDMYELTMLIEAKTKLDAVERYLFTERDSYIDRAVLKAIIGVQEDAL